MVFNSYISARSDAGFKRFRETLAFQFTWSRPLNSLSAGGGGLFDSSEFSGIHDHGRRSSGMGH